MACFVLNLMNAGIGDASFFLKKLLLACIAGLFLALLIQGYYGLQPLAITIFLCFFLFFLGGIFFFLNKYVFLAERSVIFRIGTGVSVFFLANSALFGSWHVFQSGSPISSLVHSGFILAQAGGIVLFFILTSAWGAIFAEIDEVANIQGHFSMDVFFWSWFGFFRFRYIYFGHLAVGAYRSVHLYGRIICFFGAERNCGSMAGPLSKKNHALLS